MVGSVHRNAFCIGILQCTSLVAIEFYIEVVQNRDSSHAILRNRSLTDPRSARAPLHDGFLTFLAFIGSIGVLDIANPLKAHWAAVTSISVRG
jgi:hypothetical protein